MDDLTPKIIEVEWENDPAYDEGYGWVRFDKSLFPTNYFIGTFYLDPEGDYMRGWQEGYKAAMDEVRKVVV